MTDLRILQGDCREKLKDIPGGSVHCCVTSPPYFGLRDYGVAGQIGLERSLTEYIDKLVRVFREVRRVLRDDGTLWINLGDSYANDGKWGGHTGGKHAKVLHGSPIGRNKRYTGLKPKDLIGIPWRVAFALQADGWWLRKDIIWNKLNAMPESVCDRPTSSHEYLFLMAKSERYYYDSESVKEPSQSGPSDVRKMIESRERIGGKHKELEDPLSKASATTNIGRKRAVGSPEGRNRRSVWTIATQPYPDTHFATYPPELITPCILAGCPQKVCSVCGLVLDKHQGSVSISTNGNDVYSLREDLSQSAISEGQEQVLQQAMHGLGPHDYAGSGDVQVVPEASGARSQRQTEAILQQGVRVPSHSEVPGHDQGLLHHDQGLCLDIPSESSRLDGGRLHNGASPCDGENDRQAVVTDGDCSSQERKQGGQPPGELRTDDQKAARPSAKKKTRQNHLPALQRDNSSHPTCPNCKADLTKDGSVQPGVVLDPFAGSGTTGHVALELGRSAILIELNPDYIPLIEKRCRVNLPLMFEETRK